MLSDAQLAAAMAPHGSYPTKFYDWLENPPGSPGLGCWWKFSVSRLAPDAQPYSHVEHRSTVAAAGWGDDHHLVVDLHSGVGLILKLGGHLEHDLAKRGVEVDADFRAFLEVLYRIVNEHPDWWDGPNLLTGRARHEHDFGPDDACNGCGHGRPA